MRRKVFISSLSLILFAGPFMRPAAASGREGERLQNQRPVLDGALKQRLTDRIALIVMLLRRDLGDYLPVTYLDPYRIQHHDTEPLLQVSMDTRGSSAPGISRRRADGTLAFAGPGGYIAVTVQARWAWSSPAQSGVVATATSWASHERLPGTDVVISVRASSDDPEFALRVAASMKSLAESSPSAEVARTEFESFRKSEIDRLSRLLSAPDTIAVADAARSLVVLRAEGPVVAALTSPDARMRRMALGVLADSRVGEHAVVAVAGLLSSGDSETRRLAVDALGRMRKVNGHSVATIMAVAGDSPISARVGALRVLTALKLSLPTTTAALIEGLSDDAPDVRQAAIAGLSEVCYSDRQEDASVFPALARMFQDPNEQVRTYAVWSLGNVLHVRLGGRPPFGRRDAKAIGDFMPRARALVPVFIQMLSSTNAPMRRAAAGVLAGVGSFDSETDVKTTHALTLALKDTDVEVRGSAISGLGFLGRAAARAEGTLRLIATESDKTFRQPATLAADRIRLSVYQARLDAIRAPQRQRQVRVAAPVTRTDATTWAVTTTTLPGLKGPAPVVKRARYRVQFDLNGAEEVDMDFLAFKTQRGNIWIGWEMDFYLETDSTILGGLLSPSGSVNWHSSLVASPAPYTLDAAIARFDLKVSESNITGESDQETYLRGFDRTRFFEFPVLGPEVLVNFVSIELIGAQARLVLENPETNRKRVFWIDINSRKLLREEVGLP